MEFPLVFQGWFKTWNHKSVEEAGELEPQSKYFVLVQAGIRIAMLQYNSLQLQGRSELQEILQILNMTFSGLVVFINFLQLIRAKESNPNDSSNTSYECFCKCCIKLYDCYVTVYNNNIKTTKQ